MSKKKNDPVNHPRHYTQNGVECIEAMSLYFSIEAVAPYCVLNAWKYIWRYNDKEKPEEDLRKAHWYLSYLLEQLDGCGHSLTIHKYPNSDQKKIPYFLESAKSEMIKAWLCGNAEHLSSPHGANSLTYINHIRNACDDLEICISAMNKE